MFYDSSQFKVLEAGVKLSWAQQKINTQNIANVETPGYKSEKLQFDSVLRSVQNASGNSEISQINASVVKDDSISTRPDGNNVDLETENLSLYKAYSQYSMLLTKISGEFDKYNYVLNCNM